MIGKKLSPILVEIENTIIDFDYYNRGKPEYPNDAFRATIKIFMSVMMDKIYNLQTNENFDFEDRCNMVTKFGEELKHLIKVYTNVDTVELFKFKK